MSLFITGIDTGVGKTHTAVQLLRLLRAAGASCAGMKPICGGDRRDAELLLAASSDRLAINEINPVWLKTPAAPIVGSLTEDVDIDIEGILAAFHTLQSRVEHVLVEGVGGWMVPIRPEYFMSDLAVEMKLPILVVAQNRLGCLNHAALTVRSRCSPQAALRRCRPMWRSRRAISRLRPMPIFSRKFSAFHCLLD